MFQRNNLLFGLLAGLVLPAVGFSIIYFGYSILEDNSIVSERGFSPFFRERTSAVIAICLNLLPLNQFMKQRATQSMRGIVLATVMLVAAWVIYFGKYILS
ncbi:MAG: hypothetical protein RIC19_07125 [Phaeodactylibacter sp.]|uniref:hypothetical protein n=1 Tax=Phaeodactylibacter sp. TaxID=1940289 RepID=UPI0032EAC20E